MTTEPKKTAPKNLFIDNRWLIIAAIFVFIIYLLLPVLTPFLIAAILAYICDPLVDRLCLVGISKFKLGRTLATVLVMAGILGIITLLLLILIPLLQKESLLIAERLPGTINNIRTIIEPWLQSNFGISLAIDSAQIQEIISKNWKTAGGLLGDLLKIAGSNGLALIGILANILLLPVVLFYLLRDWDGFIASITRLIPRNWQKKTTSIAVEIDQVLSEFLRGQLAVMAVMSVFYVAGLWFVGLDMALAIGVIAGLLGFVPYLGPILGLGLALLVAVLQFTSLAQVIPVLMVFGLGQLIESMVVTPKLVGERIGLHPVAVILALLAGGQLFGFTGVLLALPVTAAIAVGLRHAKDNYLSSDTYLN
ncbi:MAG: AI-2E family transporter [Methylotenera sp.]|uniref:AI-2E family transporter n=1 Tax=Methylotenera sp. TaxID=2051956 RepID=UPI002726F05D|nr:AI-2E family transporter [Methylotenera sp.]MDO9392503.1 AI-2E family transporter [Methylotenera sp.]MDP1523853.1 AI-2E family transporter [Methylotenera sp.]